MFAVKLGPDDTTGLPYRRDCANLTRLWGLADANYKVGPPPTELLRISYGNPTDI